MAGAQRHGGTVHVHHVGAGTDDFPVSNLGHAAGAVGVIVDRHIDSGLNGGHSLACGIRIDHTAHVLQMDCGSTDGHILLGGTNEGFYVVDGAGGKLNVALHALAGFQRCLGSSLAVSNIVQTIEDQEDINAGLGGLGDEAIYHIVRIRGITQQVLTTQQHTQRSLLAVLFEHADALPRVFTQETDAGVKGCAAPHFDTLETKIVHLLQHGDHVLRTHAGGDQGLLTVAEITRGKLYRTKLLSTCPGVDPGSTGSGCGRLFFPEKCHTSRPFVQLWNIRPLCPHGFIHLSISYQVINMK